MNTDFISLFETYLSSQEANASTNTVKNYLADVKHLARWLEETKGQLFDPRKLTEVDVKNFEMYLANANYTPATIERRLSSLRKFFRFLKDRNFITVSPIPAGTVKVSDPYHLIDFKNALYRANLEANTIKNYLADVSNFFAWLDEVVQDYHMTTEAKLARVTVSTLSEYKKRLLEILKLSPPSINRKLSSLRKYCQWAAENGFLKKNPFSEFPIDQAIINLESSISYSKFPPARLVQKFIRFLDYALIIPLANFFLHWARGQPHELANIEKRFYKAYRPGSTNWMGILKTVLLVGGIGVLGILALFAYQKVQKREAPNLTEKKASAFIFKGRLTSSSDKPIMKEALVIFSLYDDAHSFENLLHQEIHKVTPDKQGFFAQELDIPDVLLSSSSPVYLGITVSGDAEMRPRQQIAGQQEKALFNQEGQLIIANESPSLIASSGSFTIVAESVVTRTAEGSSGSIVLWPDGEGKIDVLGGFTNSITGIVEFADSLSINTQGLDDPFKVAVAGVPQVWVDREGGLTAQSLTIEGGATVDGSIIPALTGTYNLGSSQSAWQTLYANSVIPASTGTQGYWQRAAGAISPTNITDDLLIGATASSSATIRLQRDSGNIKLSGDAEINGGDIFTNKTTFSIVNSTATTINFGGAATAIAIGSGSGSTTIYNNSLLLGNVGIGTTTPGSAKLAVLQGNVGIGTTSPGSLLHVVGGVQVGGPAGGDKGVGSINIAGDIYKNDSAYTNPDYVFEHYATGEINIFADREGAVTYAGLMPLSAVDGFIKENFQLPLLAQRPAGGLFGRGDALLASVEEAYLHLIAHEKKLTTLENQNFVDITGYVLAAVDPEVDISEQTPKYTVYDAVGETVDRAAAYSDAIIGDLTAGTISAQFAQIGDLIAQQLTVDSLTVNNTIVSPLAEFDTVRTNVISPLATDTVTVDGKLVVRESSPSAIPNGIVFEVEGNASISGQLTVDSLQTTAVDSSQLSVDNDATISGTLRAGKIVADEIEGLQGQIASLATQAIAGMKSSESSISSEGTPCATSSTCSTFSTFTLEASDSGTLSIDTIFAGSGSFLEGLLAIGPSGFSDVSISGILSIGSQFILNENSINVLGGDLALQPLGQGGVSIADGKVYIDSAGNLTVQGNLAVAGELTAEKANINALQTGIVSPIPASDLVIRLGSTDGNTPEVCLPSLTTSGVEEEVPCGKFIIQDASGSAVLTINQQGDLTASGSATFKDVATEKLKLPQIVEQVDAEGQSLLALGSIGNGIISAGNYEITIETPFVGENSLIYITPTSDTVGMVPFVARQAPGESFTVAIPDWVEQDITFNWWIIN